MEWIFAVKKVGKGFMVSEESDEDDPTGRVIAVGNSTRAVADGIKTFLDAQCSAGKPHPEVPEPAR